jgi:hypothetical protein
MLIKSEPIRRCWSLVVISIVALAACDAASNRPASPFVLAPSAVAYTLSGVVSEPAGGAVAGATVQGRGSSATTDEAGRFTIGELAGRQELVLSKYGYEPRAIPVGQTDRDRLLNLSLAPIIQIAAGEAINVTLYPNDPGYDFPYYRPCRAPCKLVRVTVPGGGSLSLKLSAHNLDRQLFLLAFDTDLFEFCCSAQLTASLYFQGAGEAVLYVNFLEGLQGSDHRIDLSTSFQPR